MNGRAACVRVAQMAKVTFDHVAWRKREATAVTSPDVAAVTWISEYLLQNKVPQCL